MNLVSKQRKGSQLTEGNIKQAKHKTRKVERKEKVRAVDQLAGTIWTPSATKEDC